MMVEYREISTEEIDRPLFGEFVRRQEVTDCWRWIDGNWKVVPAPFTDDWSEKEYEDLISDLIRTVKEGGIVYGAFLNGTLKGFASMEHKPFGSRGQYRDMTNLHVSSDKRGQQIGSRLFELCCVWARKQGGKKIYISSHSANETQKFYRGLGCADALEVSAAHREKEPYDCQLEYDLYSIDRLLLAMMKQDDQDTKLIQHFVKVHEFARLIGQMELLDPDTQFLLEAAAVVHDIGIRKAREVYGNGSGKYQEIVGPDEVRSLLYGLGWPEELTEPIAWLVGHHHTYDCIERIEHQILVEADFLVNLYEGNHAPEAKKSVYERIFKTGGGKRLFRLMYRLEE